MTKENALKAYKKAVEKGKTDIAEDILIRHPEFKTNSGEKEVEETKSKGKK